mgnify:CR=1 FL=1
MGINRIQIKCALGNRPSSIIPKRAGFQLEGIERAGELLSDGCFADLEAYSMLKGDPPVNKKTNGNSDPVRFQGNWVKTVKDALE